MNYVDGFVAAVPAKNKESFINHARLAAEILKENGALKIVECWGEDIPEGKVTSFPMAVKLKDGENVVFSWITWPSKEARNKGMEKLMSDPRMNHENNPMPFDGQRVIFGGFDVILEF